MALEFKLPDIGEGIAEGEIVKWLVQPGDQVDEHQPLVEVMTDKATVEIPAPRAGTISELKAAEGDVVPVGTVIFVLDSAGDGKGAPQKEAPAKDEQKKSSGSEAPAAKPAGTAAKERPAAAPKASGGRTLEFKLPDIGEGIAEGEIVQWLVEEGTAVEEHQPIVEVMTDKATVEIPAPASGTIAKRLVAAGDVVPIGTVIFHLATAGAAAREEPAEREEAAPAARRAEPAKVGAAASSANGQARRGGGDGNGNGRVLAVPSARRVARELGIDLAEVSGSGRNGVIRRKDVEAFHAGGGAERRAAAAPTAQTAPAPAAKPIAIPVGERETRVPFRGVRRKIAEAMARSMFTATHFTVVEELDVTDLVKLRAKAKEIGARDGVNVTYMPFIMKACAIALARHPMLNASLDESTQELVTYHYVNLGIATDTENGLIVPVIRDVQSKGMLQMASELKELAERTRAGKVRPEDLQGGTFTITNAGNIGGTLATPIINFPEIAILGVHRLMKRPGVVETPEGDRIEVRQYMNLSISVDHRLADGADAARFLVTMKELLESPGLLAL
jgi:pyruvate dehydrogenase E2 component (dihydrolipoamide acetyltransferase)